MTPSGEELLGVKHISIGGLIEIALGAKTLCSQLNNFYNSYDLPEEVMQAQNILEELLYQYAGGAAPQAQKGVSNAGKEPS